MTTVESGSPPTRPESAEPAGGADGAGDTAQRRLAELYADMGRNDIQSLWDQAPDLMPPSPRPKAVPWMWPWRTVLRLAERAGELVPVERGGERRALAMANPGLGGRPFATPTLWAAMQYLNAGESAPAHRHAAAAIRFVISGEGVWTTVNGEPCPMAPGDLVLTPSMAWHEHHSGSDQAMVWFDGLDLPLVNGLDANFFEISEADYLEEFSGRPESSRSAAVFGHPGLLPDVLAPTDRHSPLMVYRWSATDRALTDLARATGRDDVSVRYVDPTSGRDALPTMRCAMRRLAAGTRTRTTRTVGSSLLVVLSGTGRSVVDGVSFGWERGDVLAVPSWAAVDHQAEQDADLFVVSDAPVLEALRLDRTETLPTSQPVLRDWRDGS